MSLLKTRQALMAQATCMPGAPLFGLGSRNRIWIFTFAYLAPPKFLPPRNLLEKRHYLPRYHFSSRDSARWVCLGGAGSGSKRPRQFGFAADQPPGEMLGVFCWRGCRSGGIQTSTRVSFEITRGSKHF